MTPTPVDDLILRIGEYQLRNLQTNRVSFHFFDLSDQVAQTPSELLRGSVRVAPNRVLEKVRADGLAADAPIVLICENGAKSLAAARELAQQSFLNVFVVEGGSAAF